MDATQRAELLKSARSAVSAHLLGLPQPEKPAACAQGAAGVFVSLYALDGLRGCTGVLDAHLDVGRAVMQCAVTSATADPRFTPLAIDELSGLTIEISVLDTPSPMQQVSSLEIGRHGIIVTSGARRGLLLPRVGVDFGMSVVEFLDAGCRKAALPPGAWRTSAVTVELFTAEVFGDLPLWGGEDITRRRPGLPG